jgi:hypothetical protein
MNWGPHQLSLLYYFSRKLLMLGYFNHSIKFASVKLMDGCDSICIKQVTRLHEVILTRFLQVLSNVILTECAKLEGLTYLSSAQSTSLYGCMAS